MENKPENIDMPMYGFESASAGSLASRINQYRAAGWILFDTSTEIRGEPVQDMIHQVYHALLGWPHPNPPIHPPV